MAFVHVNPRYREQLARLGLRTPADFLDLDGVVLCGHPDRHVRRVTLGEGSAAVSAFLKREHRVPWRDRLANLWSGFGFVAKSCREYRLLHELAAAGIGCPEPIAAGEDGRAFLLVREVSGGRDLRAFLTETATSAGQRRRVAARLGAAIARLHAAGFDHPDLYSKHVLVRGEGAGLTFSFLDWQRSRRGRVRWTLRWRDLAALDATLADDLAAPRERLLCLRVYLRCTAATGVRIPRLAYAAQEVRRRSARLLTRRRIRELRQPPLACGVQNLVWLDGEALCVTQEFRAELSHIPEWLTLPISWAGARNAVLRREVVPVPGRHAILVQRHSSRPLAWLWGWLRRRRLASPELEQLGTLFRLQRYGIVTPRLLAVGQRHSWPWRTTSMLLTEPLDGTTPFADWLRTQPTTPRRCGRMLTEAGSVLRRIHDAGYCLDGQSPGEVLLVQQRRGEPARVVLGTVAGLRRRPRQALLWHDLARLSATIEKVCGRAGQRRLQLGYRGGRLLRRVERGRVAG